MIARMKKPNWLIFTETPRYNWRSSINLWRTTASNYVISLWNHWMLLNSIREYTSALSLFYIFSLLAFEKLAILRYLNHYNFLSSWWCFSLDVYSPEPPQYFNFPCLQLPQTSHPELIRHSRHNSSLPVRCPFTQIPTSPTWLLGLTIFWLCWTSQGRIYNIFDLSSCSNLGITTPLCSVSLMYFNQG